MIRPRLRKVGMDVWSHRLRSLLVVASVTVGLFAVGVIATLHQVITDDLRQGYAAVNPPNVRLVLQPFEAELVDTVAKVDGVRQAEAARDISARFDDRQGNWIGIELHAAPKDKPRDIGTLQVIAGTFPPGDREIVIDQYKLADTHAQIGDMIPIELPSGQSRELTLVGVVGDQTVGAYYGGAGFFLAPVQGYINQKTVEYLQQSAPYRYNVIYLTVTGDHEDEAYLHAVANRARQAVEDAGETVINVAVRGSFDHPNARYVEAISIILLFLGLLVLFLSGFLITNTLQAIIQQQVTQIGILKTLGGQRYQVIILYMLLILVFSLAAAALAVPLASRIAFARMAPLALVINMAYRGPRVLPAVVVLQVAMALFMPQAAALLPIWQGARISVVEALSGVRQSGKPRRNLIDRLIGRLKGFSRPTLISIRNTFRRKGRLALTLITLSLGGAIFIATFNVRVTMDGFVDLISRYFLADVNLTLEQPQRVQEIQQVLAGVPGLKLMEAWGSARSEVLLADGSAGESVSLLAPPERTQLVDPVVIEGRWLQPGDQQAIALNERFQLDYPDIRVGDTIRLNVNGEETTWTVVGFFQLAGRSAGLLAYTTFESLSRVTGQPDQAQTFRIVAANPSLSKAEQEALGQAIEAHLEARDLHVADITTGSYLSSSAAQGFATLTGFLLFLAILTALVGSIGLAGTMSLNVLERTREIGILRAIGATNRRLMQMVLIEGLMIGLLSWGVAALAAFPMSKLLSDRIAMALFGNPSTMVYTPTGFLVWLAAVIVLSVLASLIPARNASRLTIREVLAYE